MTARIYRSVCLIVLLACGFLFTQAQSTNERTFRQSKTEIENALKAMQQSMSGRLPVLDGFSNATDHPLEQYQRGFFQASAKVISTPGGGSVVRMQTKITAWYADQVAAKSGYQLLNSNGRIESDILDQLAERLSTSSAPQPPPTTAATDSIHPPPDKPFPSTAKRFSTLKADLVPGPSLGTSAQPPQPAKPEKSLQAEADSLAETLKNTVYPKNLVAVKKSGTPVVATPSLNAKPEFLATMHDEFELLDFNANWVHVRISGLSRGWIWRNSVEMPDGIPDTDTKPASSPNPVADLFKVSREDKAQFPGDWPPLRNKMVKIVSVQETGQGEGVLELNHRLEYVKVLLQTNYAELAKSSQELSGIVVIFDAADGGMIAATTATVQQWKTGTLSDSALWHACFFDPPEALDSSAPSGSK